jgi:transcriptional regulator with XRE-family HTH domain
MNLRENHRMDADLGDALRQVDLEKFGKRIRELRVSLGLTQSVLAGDDVTIGYISRIEAGQRRPDARLVDLFAERLSSTAEYLVTGVPSQLVDEVRLALHYVELALETGEAVDAQSYLASISERLDDPRLPDHWRYEAGYLRGRLAEALGDYATAIKEVEAIAFLEPLHPRSPTALIALSRCLRENGQLVRATETAARGLDALKAQGLSGSDEAIQLSVTMAAAYFERGDTPYAIHLATEAVAAAEAMGSPLARASAYWNASTFQSQGGNLDAAIVLASRALALFSEQRDARNLARLRVQLGRMLSRQVPTDTREAIKMLKRGRRELLATSASPADIARCDATLARAFVLDGQYDEARNLANSVLETTADISVTSMAGAHCVLGQADAAADDRVSAKRHYRAAVGLLTGIGADRQAAETWMELGGLFEVVGDFAGASNAYRSAAAATGLSLPSTLSSTMATT